MSANSFLVRAASSPESVFRYLVLLFGALLIFGGIVYSAYNLFRILTFEKTAAKVASIGEDRNRGKMPATIYSIWVGFDLPGQIVYTRAGKSVFYSPYKKGDTVTVYYDPQNANDAFINTFGTLWFVPIVFLYLPGLALLVWMMSGTLKSFFSKLFGRG